MKNVAIIPSRDGEPIIPDNMLGAHEDLIGGQYGLTIPDNPPAALEWIEYEILRWDIGGYADDSGMPRPQRLATRGKLINYIQAAAPYEIKNTFYTPIIIPKIFLRQNAGALFDGSYNPGNAVYPANINGAALWADGFWSGAGGNGIFPLPEGDDWEFYGSVIGVGGGSQLSFGLAACYSYGWRHGGG